jgi:ectoine hydroxylase-related dioxygenase (phytanoyl-CoA dioxygenase family)
MYHPWQELLDKVAAPGAPIKAWTLNAGDCLVMHPKTIHSSLPRTTTKPGRRLAFSTRWLGDDAIWAPDDYCRLGLAPEVEAQLPYGQPPSTAIYPIVWRKERERELA